MLPDFRLYTKLSGVAKTENAVCTVQAQKTEHRFMGQDRRAREKLKHLWASNL